MTAYSQDELRASLLALAGARERSADALRTIERRIAARRRNRAARRAVLCSLVVAALASGAVVLSRSGGSDGPLAVRTAEGSVDDSADPASAGATPGGAAVGESPPTATGGPIANVDHWHAALGVDVCGEWLADPPAFDQSALDPATRAGLHSHGDGLVHVHPFTDTDAQANATLGRFMAHGGWSIDVSEMRLWDGKTYRDGAPCDDGEPGHITLTVNGVAHPGDPANYRIADGDVIAIGFLPDGELPGTPPSVATLRSTDAGSAVQPDPNPPFSYESVVDPASVVVEVVNTNAPPGSALEIADRLREAGYTSQLPPSSLLLEVPGTLVECWRVGPADVEALTVALGVVPWPVLSSIATDDPSDEPGCRVSVGSYQHSVASIQTNAAPGGTVVVTCRTPEALSEHLAARHAGTSAAALTFPTPPADVLSEILGSAECVETPPPAPHLRYVAIEILDAASDPEPASRLEARLGDLGFIDLSVATGAEASPDLEAGTNPTQHRQVVAVACSDAYTTPALVEAVMSVADEVPFDVRPDTSAWSPPPGTCRLTVLD